MDQRPVPAKLQAAEPGDPRGEAELLRVSGCQLYWLPAPEEQNRPAVLLASGELQLRTLPSPPTPDQQDSVTSTVLLTVQGGEGFFCSLCLPGMDVCMFDDFLTFPAPEDASKDGKGGGVCGLVLKGGGLRRTAKKLQDSGCKLFWQPRASVRSAATAVGYAGGAVAAGIELATEAVGGGVKLAGEALTKSGLMKKENAEVPEAVKKGTSMARQGSLLATTYAGKLTHGIAQGAGWAAGKAYEIAEMEWEERNIKSEQWHQDAKALASASMDAGAEIFKAAAWAPYKIGAKAADAGCDVVGHRYGDDAGTTARDGIHSVGNVLTSAALVSPVTVAKMAAARAGQEVAARIDGRWVEVDETGASSSSDHGKIASAAPAEEAALPETELEGEHEKEEQKAETAEETKDLKQELINPEHTNDKQQCQVAQQEVHERKNESGAETFQKTATGSDPADA